MRQTSLVLRLFILYQRTHTHLGWKTITIFCKTLLLTFYILLYFSFFYAFYCYFLHMRTPLFFCCIFLILMSYFYFILLFILVYPLIIQSILPGQFILLSLIPYFFRFDHSVSFFCHSYHLLLLLSHSTILVKWEENIVCIVLSFIIFSPFKINYF